MSFSVGHYEYEYKIRHYLMLFTLRRQAKLAVIELLSTRPLIYFVVKNPTSTIFVTCMAQAKNTEFGLKLMTESRTRSCSPSHC